MAGRIVGKRGRWWQSKIGTAFLLLLCVGGVFFIVSYIGGYATHLQSSDDINARRQYAISQEAKIHQRKKSKWDEMFGKQVEEPAVCKQPKHTLSGDKLQPVEDITPLKCSNSKELLRLKAAEVTVNKQVLNGRRLSRCIYRAIDRLNDDHFYYSEPHIEEDNFDKKIQHDFFRIECFLDDNNKKRHQLNKRSLKEMKSPKIEKHQHFTKPSKNVDTNKNSNDLNVVNHQHQGKNSMTIIRHKQSGKLVTHKRSLKQQADPVTETVPEEKYEYDPAGNDNADFDQLFSQIYPKDDTLQRLKERLPSPHGSNMSILILGLESMSHLSYQRYLPKTYNFLIQKLDAVVLNGYNILGDGTVANVVPLLTGKNVTELPEARRNSKNSGFVDHWPLMWTEFEENGYVTLFAEDEPSLGMFNLRLKGFEHEPTDHYMRPFWQAAWDSDLNEKSARFCLGPRPKHKYLLNYVSDFFSHPKYKKAPRFAFAFHGELSHADNSLIQNMDADLVQFLSNLKTDSILDNTLLIVMGDHGARYRKVRHTMQGKLEERLPLMSMVFPQWFKSRYPHAMENLKSNSKRLTTAYDVYETLFDLLDTTRMKVKPKYNARGRSLFQEIPKNRTCTSAGIEMHWCTCMSWSDLPTDNEHIQKAAEEVMNNINRQIDDYKQYCVPLKMTKILEGRKVMPNEQVLKYFNSIDDDHRLPNFTKKLQIDLHYYQVTIQTLPNNGIYEATVAHDTSGLFASLSKNYNVVSEVSRVDAYEDQPSCIQEKYPNIMKFCLCSSYSKAKSNSKTSRKPKFYKPQEDWLS